MPRRDLHAAFVARFARPEITVDHIKALCTRKGWKTGRDGYFAKGQRTGIAQKHYKPIGFERITIDGYRERKVNDDLPFNRRWRLVHLVEWEAANGPIPEGHALKCLNGDRLNCDPSNWEPIPRGVLARLNGGRFRKTLPYDEAAPELKPIVMANAKLKHAAHEKRRAAGKGEA